MPTNLTRASYDTLVNEAEPNRNYGSWNRITVLGGPAGSVRYAYVFLPGTPPAGASVSQATLRVWLQGSGWAGGPHTITARRIIYPWRESLLTWNRTVTGQATTQNAASTSVTDGVDGQLVELDVTQMMADVAGGAAWHGVRLEVDTADGTPRRLYSSEATSARRPQLEVAWNRPPLAPIDLSPSGGQSVSIASPWLAWNFRDRESDPQAEFQVQLSTTSTVDSTGAFATPEFDTGWTASAGEHLDLSATAYAGLTDGDVRYWIVRARDEHGATSPWSAVHEFRRDTKGSLDVSSPIDGGTVDQTTPPITSTLTGRDQEALAYRLWEQRDGYWLSVWSTGRFLAEAADGVPFTFDLPAGLIRRSGNYMLDVWSYDTIDRVATPGDLVHVPASATFTFTRSATPGPVTALEVVDDAPGVRLRWNRDPGLAVPDFFALVVDGVRVFDRLDPLEFSLGGDPIEFELLYYGARPNIEHTFEVEAVVEDTGSLKHSQGNAAVTRTPRLPDGGTWFVDDEGPPFPTDARPRRVRLRGAETPDLEIGESSGVFHPIGRSDPVYIVDAIRGLEGSVSGTVEADDPAGAGFIENFAWMKRIENVGRRWRLVFGDINVPVQVHQATDTHADSHLRRHPVSIDVSQVGEFEEGQ